MYPTKEITRGYGVSKHQSFILILMSMLAVPLAGAVAQAPPNIVLFVMDDVGIGDIGCFGNDTIKTPNIDGLAREGAMLTQHMSFPTCTPSRAALMTGRFPIRYGMGTNGTVKVFLHVSSPGGLPSNETTVAEVLKGAGYATALIGKWHLGMSCMEAGSCSDPNSHGFDYFFGLPLTNLRDCGTENSVVDASCKTHRKCTMRKYFAGVVFVVALFMLKTNRISRKTFIPILLVALTVSCHVLMTKKLMRMNCMLIENRQVVEQPLLFDHLTERLHSRAIHFMERHRDQPFLLVMSFVQAHTALYNNEQFRNHSVHGRYGDNVEEMDWSVGEVLTSLKKLGLEDKTFVYLTSDNGGHVEELTDEGERHGGWNGIYKAGKGSTWEGGIRVPTIVKFPGVVPPGTVISQPTHLPDVLPTVAGIAGAKLPDDRFYDGQDLLPLLTNPTSDVVLHEFMFHYCGGYLNAVKYTPKVNTTYKLHYATTHLLPGPHGIKGCFDTFMCQCSGPTVIRHDPPLVYDVTRDPGESSPLDQDDPWVKEIVRRVAEAVSRHIGTAPNKHMALQFGALQTFLPRPWNHPVCPGFPFQYSCADPYLEQIRAEKKGRMGSV